MPPYSPDLSPIELCWSKLKEILRPQGVRTSDALDEAITIAINLITDENSLNWFNHCGLFFEPMRESYFLWRGYSQIAVILEGGVSYWCPERKLDRQIN